MIWCGKFKSHTLSQWLSNWLCWTPWRPVLLFSNDIINQHNLCCLIWSIIHWQLLPTCLFLCSQLWYLISARCELAAWLNCTAHSQQCWLPLTSSDPQKKTHQTNTIHCRYLRLNNTRSSFEFQKFPTQFLNFHVLLPFSWYHPLCTPASQVLCLMTWFLHIMINVEGRLFRWWPFTIR